MHAHTFAFQSPCNIPLASVNYQDRIKTTSNPISVRGETDQEEKTVRAMTSSAPNKMSSERYVICPGENPSPGAVMLVHMLAVQFSARLFGSLNAGYIAWVFLSLQCGRGWPLPETVLYPASMGQIRPGRARSGLIPPVPRQALLHR
jgi:hypothetical protein